VYGKSESINVYDKSESINVYDKNESINVYDKSESINVYDKSASIKRIWPTSILVNELQKIIKLCCIWVLKYIFVKM
jgi:hypothetical protein